MSCKALTWQASVWSISLHCACLVPKSFPYQFSRFHWDLHLGLEFDSATLSDLLGCVLCHHCLGSCPNLDQPLQDTLELFWFYSERSIPSTFSILVAQWTLFQLYRGCETLGWILRSQLNDTGDELTDYVISQKSMSYN